MSINYKQAHSNNATLDTNAEDDDSCDTSDDHVAAHIKTRPLQPDQSVLDLTMRKRYRFLMLFLNSLVLVGPYFCYDNPGALEVQIEEIFQIKT